MLGQAPIGGLILKLSLPAVAAQVINVLYNVVDRMYIGNIPDIGATALTGVGVTFPVLMIVSSFAAFAGMGGAPLAGIRLGAGDKAGAERILGNCLSLRDITNGMRSAGGNLNHMGIGSTPHEMRSATKTGSETVAALDKARWDIEIFFKTIKLLLRVKSFVGTNAYAVYTQIRTAMIAVLLLRMLKAQSKYAWHMSNPVSFLRLNLFNKIDLWKWLNEPFEKPPSRQKRYGMGCFSSFAASLPATPHDSSILFPFAQTLGQVWRLPW